MHPAPRPFRSAVASALFSLAALVVADWTLDANNADGSPLHLAGQTADVVRRQSNGHWLFAIDSPFGAAGAS